MSLHGKVALVTGGGKVVGSGIARTLARHGAKVGINYHGSEEAAIQTLRRITEDGGEGILLKGDVSRRQDVEAMMHMLADTYGGIDILVNNAALQKNLWLMEYREENYDLLMQTNLKGYFICMQSALPFLKMGGEGRIINVSSIHAKRPTNFDPVYSMTKGGIKMLTREAAIEFAQYGITVNAIELGAIKIGDKSGNPREIRSKPNPAPFRKYLTGRYGTPEEVGELAAYLAGTESAFMTGSSIRFDGGRALM